MCLRHAFIAVLSLSSTEESFRRTALVYSYLLRVAPDILRAQVCHFNDSTPVLYPARYKEQWKLRKCSHQVLVSKLSRSNKNYLSQQFIDSHSHFCIYIVVNVSQGQRATHYKEGGRKLQARISILLCGQCCHRQPRMQVYKATFHCSNCHIHRGLAHRWAAICKESLATE